MACSSLSHCCLKVTPHSWPSNAAAACLQAEVGWGADSAKRALQGLALAGQAAGAACRGQLAGLSTCLLQLAGELAAAVARMPDGLQTRRQLVACQAALPGAARLAEALQEFWQQQEQRAADELELAQAAATRSCANLRCANLGPTGGPAARQGADSKRCSACLAVWYCCAACQRADWKAGHKRVCKELAVAQALASQALNVS